MEANLFETTQLFLFGLTTGYALAILTMLKWALENKKIVWADKQ